MLFLVLPRIGAWPDRTPMLCWGWKTFKCTSRLVASLQELNHLDTVEVHRWSSGTRRDVSYTPLRQL